MSDAGRVTYARAGEIHILRYHGRVTYPLAPAIKRLGERLLEHGGQGGWVFDLSSAESIDSTNLGVLARIAARAGAANDAHAVILSTNEDVTAVLSSMGFDETFDIVTEAPLPAAAGSGVTLQDDAASGDELASTMLDAHRMLMTLSAVGREQFKDVVSQLEAEVGQAVSGAPR